MKKLSTVVAVVGLAVSSITGGAFAASATEAAGNTEIVTITHVWKLPASATGVYTTWYPQEFVNDTGKIPADCGTYQKDVYEVKYQKDVYRVPATEKAVIDAINKMPADGKLTLGEEGDLFNKYAVKSASGKTTVKCEAPPVAPAPEPNEPPVVIPPVIVEPPVVTEPPVVLPPVVVEPPVVLPPAPTPTVTPIVTKRLVQTDTYRYTTKAERARILGYVKDGKLTFREDREQWNDSTWTVTEQTLTNGKVTKTKVVKAGGNGAKAKGSKLTMSFVLGKGATHNAPFGKTGKVAQTYIK